MYGKKVSDTSSFFRKILVICNTYKIQAGKHCFAGNRRQTALNTQEHINCAIYKSVFPRLDEIKSLKLIYVLNDDI